MGNEAYEPGERRPEASQMASTVERVEARVSQLRGVADVMQPGSGDE
nr:hypothetical protein [Streptomyces flavidovirens]